MDPEQALLGAEEKIQTGEYESAEEFLDSYASWRRVGGSKPTVRRMDGDFFYRFLVKEFEEKFDTKCLAVL